MPSNIQCVLGLIKFTAVRNAPYAVWYILRVLPIRYCPYGIAHTVLPMRYCPRVFTPRLFTPRRDAMVNKTFGDVFTLVFFRFSLSLYIYK